MKVTMIADNILMGSKFRGCFLGSLLGDCLGSPYEFGKTSKVVLQKYFDKLEGPMFKAPVIQYTDDSEMSKSIAESFISCNTFNSADMAKRFVKEFYSEPHRAYGKNVALVFQKLKDQKFKDPFGPAKEQFEGAGSLGNGGAMRVMPVALFYHKDYETMIDVARKSAQITHTHRDGYNGAILQTIAVHQSLYLDPEKEMNISDFSQKLLDKMSSIETEVDELGIDDPSPYKRQLSKMNELLGLSDEDAHDEEINKVLGTDISALYSVPTAIYCFLRAFKQIPGINTDNPFRRCIQYAISLGGDTDTIACMAGAICGAYYGDKVINKSLIQHCEDSQKFVQLADELFNLTNN